MTIQKGDKLPEASLLRLGADGPETVELSSLTSGRAVIFALPGAYTGTCSTQHVPSFIRVADQLREKGVEHIICIAVNDPFVMGAWREATGADKAGIEFLSDADGAFTKAVGMGFDAPPAGLFGRSKRYAMIVENGTVTALNVESAPGTCEISGGETLLAEL